MPKSYSSQLSSGDASDSICPKGWGIAEHDGDGSYRKIITDTYGIKRRGDDITQSYNEYINNITINNILIDTILSYLMSGNYDYKNGNRTNRTANNTTWGKRAYKVDNTITGSILSFTSLRIRTYGYNNYRGMGYPVRSVAK